MMGLGLTPPPSPPDGLIHRQTLVCSSALTTQQQGATKFGMLYWRTADDEYFRAGDLLPVEKNGLYYLKISIDEY